MADLVNLRMARKRRERADKARAAEESRILHGRTRTERLAEAATRERTASTLDAHRREHPSGRPDDET
jgi:hypothetical protein